MSTSPPGTDDKKEIRRLAACKRTRVWRTKHPDKVKEYSRQRSQCPAKRNQAGRFRTHSSVPGNTAMLEFLRRHDISFSEFGRRCGFRSPATRMHAIVFGARYGVGGIQRPSADTVSEITRVVATLDETVNVESWWPKFARSVQRSYDEKLDGPLDPNLLLLAYSPFVSAEDKLLLEDAIDTVLSDRERKVLDGRFQDRLTLDDLGAQLGVTRERVRQIQNDALVKIREYVRGQDPPPKPVTTKLGEVKPPKPFTTKLGKVKPRCGHCCSCTTRECQAPKPQTPNP